MKSILRKVILVLSLAVGLQTNVKAQLVYIPDSAFRAWLNINYASCMVGDSIDPTCPAVLITKNINLRNKGVSDITGIEIFVNDSVLDCSYNQLTNLPNLPDSMKSFYCTNNQITNLPALPSSLKVIWCSNNQLTSLPTLPNTLTRIECDYNQLTILPSLPSTLLQIFCSFNQLTIMPSVPSMMTALVCDNNQLTSLPVLPNSLINLRCNSNQITSLPPLPDSLMWLYCSSNQLTSLPTLPSSLTILACGRNPLMSLPNIPASLLTLSCYNNQLTSLPTLPNSLTSLACYDNQLISLPTLPNSLISIYCYSNQLTSLPTLPIYLNNLFCSNNQLTSLPTLPTSLNLLHCYSNPITCLPALNNYMDLNFNNTLVNCVTSYGIGISSLPIITDLPICDVFNSNECNVSWNIKGNTYVDIDSNCLIGINESGYANQKVNLYKNGLLDQQSYTNGDGNYFFDTFIFDTYKIELDTIGLPFEIDCPSTGFYLDIVAASDSLKRNRDFALKCKGVDLAATSIYTQNLRPASIRKVNIQAGDITNLYGSNCAAGVCGTVSITITGPCNYYSSPSYALTPNAVSGNVLTYYISDFGAISYDSTFDFNLLVDTTNALGNQICITVNVYTKCAQELNYSNNQIIQCFTVVGSYDPNDKAVSPTTTLDINGNKWLNYTIRFQNTGTAEAEHIYITDTLSNKLDISTFTLLNYSHEPFVQLFNDGLLKFNFPFIHLPDSNTNEPASHGYVQYKIRAKDNLTLGNTIENTANIYFDFNAPVITNTTSNTIIDCNIPTTNLSATLCNGDAYSLNGMEYYSTGIYNQNLLTAFGCDSAVRLNLTVNKSTIIRSSDTLLATILNATSYQWINCITGTAIVGANTQTYNPTQSGSYAVVIDFGGCIDTSNCYYFSPLSINEINASNINIQPNPFNNELKVTLDKNYNGVIEIYNTLGALLTFEKIQSKNVTLNTSNWNAGVYI